MASARAGGGVSGTRYIMWALTTPSLIRAVAIRARLSSDVLPLTVEKTRRLSGGGSGDGKGGEGGGGGRGGDYDGRDESASDGEGDMSSSDKQPWHSAAWQSKFQDESVANMASHGMYVSGFLGRAGSSLTPRESGSLQQRVADALPHLNPKRKKKREGSPRKIDDFQQP